MFRKIIVSRPSFVFRSLPPKRYSSNDEDKKKLTELLKSLTLKKDDVGDTGISAKLAKPMHRKNLPPKPARVIETSATEDLDMQELDKRLHQAARKVAESIGGPEGERTKSDLYFMLEAHELEKSAAATGHPITIDLAKVLYGMKIVKKKISPEHFVTSRSGSSPDMTRPADGEIPSPKMPPVPFRRRKERVPLPSSERKFDLYANERLGIFDVDQLPPAEPEDCLETWRRLKQKELQYLITYPAENAYEEMIRWTDQGKLWHYPIDNEQGLTEEAKVPFYEHVFLDHWMEEFPHKGPVRQFLAVVLLGLSRNPYMTVERKREHFMWFRQYFDQKEDILRRAGAFGD